MILFQNRYSWLSNLLKQGIDLKFSVIEKEKFENQEWLLDKGAFKYEI
jgi:hypothetical protein